MYEFDIGNDIKTAKDFLKYTDTDLSRELNIPRSTLRNWEKGISKPSPSSLEKFYSYLYNSKIRLNEVKEQFFKDANTPSVKYLFHGAKQNIESLPDLQHSKDENDFGKGFYLGDNFLQSASFVCNYPKSSVYIAELKLNEKLKIAKYDVDEEWMLTIAFFRRKLQTYKNSTYLKSILEKCNNADIIKAPIADNRMFLILDEFISGNITDLQCKSALSATDLGKQYVIVSSKAMKNLKIIQHCYLCAAEKALYFSDKEKTDLISSQKVKYVEREFAGKGKYIDELLI